MAYAKRFRLSILAAGLGVLATPAPAQTDPSDFLLKSPIQVRVVITDPTVALPAGGADAFTAACPTGYAIISGGYRLISPNDPAQVANLRIVESYPDNGASPRSWKVMVHNVGPAASSVSMNIRAVCMQGKSN